MGSATHGKLMQCGIPPVCTTQLFLHEISEKHPEEFARKASTTDTVGVEKEADSVHDVHGENEMVPPVVNNNAGNEVLA
ncbi:unnamed protein product [Phytophthora fragariaefolia]|uniref:Unnamed protein product n=1 Tax=Phytophthora fragariaefolia TaxID=1490495 RepID=A0A9W6X263_9STRA|nr:unnamed protein product [Phytophthora fragariaefolia]